jgi:hypothetical protein
VKFPSLFHEVFEKEIGEVFASNSFLLRENNKQTSLLKALKTAQVVNLPGTGESSSANSIQAVTLSCHPNFKIGKSILPHTLFVREFYPRIFDLLMKNNHSVLLGNPGISKSWFQLYILYRLVNENLCDYHGNCPKVIIRQVGENNMYFYFPQDDKAFSSSPMSLDIFETDSALYLFEPGGSLFEPPDTEIKTVATCSPDARRYKEFCKRGGVKYYMPGWSLDELQMVGAYIASHCNRNRGDFTPDAIKEADLTPDAIEERFNRFGGIFRHVIPSSKMVVDQAERNQEMTLANAKAVHTFVMGTDIEKTDERKENVSHFLLHYKIHYGNKNKDEFRHFDMEVASNYVRKQLSKNSVSALELVDMCSSLRLMFIGGRTKTPELFENVVYHMLRIKRDEWKEWKIWNGKCWVDHEWPEFSGGEVVEIGQEKIMDMKPGILYYPADRNFPLVDFLFVKEKQGCKEFCGIQVTFDEHHDKKLSVYKKFYDSVGLKLNSKFSIYFVPRPQHLDGYAKREAYQYFIPKARDKRPQYNNVQFFTVNSTFLESGKMS